MEFDVFTETCRHAAHLRALAATAAAHAVWLVYCSHTQLLQPCQRAQQLWQRG